MPEAVQRVDWPRERLESYQLDLLRQLLAHAKRHSRWYAETRLSDIDPATATPGDLAAIPPTSKAELVDNFDAMLADPRLSLARCEEHLAREAAGGAYLFDEYRVSVSGGTSGTRVIGVFGWDAFAHTWNAGMRMVVRWAARTQALAGPPKLAAVVAASNVHGSQQLAGIFGRPDTVRIAITDPMRDVVAALNAARPDAMVVYPSVLPTLAHEAAAGRLDIAPKFIMCGAESLLPEHEDAVKRTWRCATASVWGATESGNLGCGSGFESGMLLLDDHVIVEPVDEHGQRVEAGQRSAKVYVTPLHRHALPLIRYELTDQLVLRGEPAKCGSCLTATSNVEGRLDDAFVYGDVVVNAHLFRSTLSLQKAVLDYQVVQTTDGARLRVVSVGDFDERAVATTLASQLRRIGVEGAVVAIDKVAHIERDPQSTKLRRYVPLPAD
jgi:phenylacetate-CoA ligase